MQSDRGRAPRLRTWAGRSRLPGGMRPSLRVLALLTASLSGSLSGCFVDREYSNETIIEFEACATFGDACEELTDFRVVGRELGEEASAVIGDRVRFRDVMPNRVVTFDVEGYSGSTLFYRATCDIGATPYTTVEADCRNDVEAVN